MSHAYSGETPWRRVRRTIPVATPAAGADWSETVPAGKLWRLVSVSATFTSSAGAANRQPNLVLADGSGTFLTIPPVAVQAASKAGQLAWIEHGSAYAVGDDQAMPLPELTLMPGWSVGSSTGAIQSGDTWEEIVLLVIETTILDGRADINAIPTLLVEVTAGG